MISVPEFYTDRSVFITGATGFIGKVLIEKLLRSCPRIKRIYTMVRSKKNKTSHERMEHILNEKLFDRVKENQPDYKSKVVVVEGDLSEPELGISQDDLEAIIADVSIIFHSAATIRFNETLREAVQLNVLGVRKIIQLCRKLKKLDVLVHVSTAFTDCDRDYIEEMIYPSSVRPQQLIDALEWMDDEKVNLITPKLIGKKPNTYTYTKQLAEVLLQEEAADLPVAIVRPSIVAASWKEPVPGWVDNINGPTGLYLATGKGILRCLKIDPEALADIVPVDFPVNMLITTAWHTHMTKPKEILVYNCTTGKVNPFTWGEMEHVLMKYFKRMPYGECFRRPKIVLTTNSWLHNYMTLFSHLIPAYVADVGFRLIGKKPRMVKIYNRLHKATEVLYFFISQSWHFTHTNRDALKLQLSPEDRKMFYIDPVALDWQSYVENYCLGTKQFILKEDESSLPAARAHLKMLRNIRYTFNAVIAIALWRLLIARSQIARNLWYLIMSLVFKFVRFFRPLSN